MDNNMDNQQIYNANESNNPIGTTNTNSQYSQPYQQPYTENIPYNYKPLSAWAYFGYQLLFFIPIVGFICLIVFSLGGTSNINLKNYARSYFCLFAIAIVIGILGGILMSVLGVSLFDTFNF